MRLFRKLFCTHYWVYITRFDWFTDIYGCTKCGKEKLFKDAPVNWIGGSTNE